MDGAFACPECGSAIEVEGLAPGRQVRCGFCDRLLEVPYLPRVPSAGMKRQRFGRSPGRRWAWAGLTVLAVLLVGIGGYRAVRRYFRSAREGSIHRLVASSRANEQAGRLDQALVELDAALDLARQSGSQDSSVLAEQRPRRAALAVKEALTQLDRLRNHGPTAFPLGEWLTLVARCTKDPDLAPVAGKIGKEFGQSVTRQARYELETALKDDRAGRAAAAMRGCDRVAHILPHVPEGSEKELRQEAGALATRLIQSHGVAIEMPGGDLVLGTPETYRTHLVPVLVKGLEAKGFLPYQKSSPWRSAWDHARYRLRLEINEQYADTYMMSQNRLTRIEVRLNLTTAGQSVWQTAPRAVTQVPLPNLPVYLSNKLAATTERTDECERIFYENARSQIDEKISFSLTNMPVCCP